MPPGRTRSEVESVLEEIAENFPDKGTAEENFLAALKDYLPSLRDDEKTARFLRAKANSITYAEMNLTTSAFLEEKLAREHIALQPFETFYKEAWDIIVEIFKLLPSWRTQRLGVILKYHNQAVALKRKEGLLPPSRERIRR